MAYSDDKDEDLIVPRKWWEKLPRAAWGEYRRVDQPDGWFEVYELTETVYAIYEPGQFEEVISYLALGGERAALIDTGNGIGDINAVVKGLTDLPVTVVNTHTHGDHIGKNHMFDEVAVYDCPYSRDSAEKGKSSEYMAHFLDEGMVWKPLPRYFDPEGFHVPPFKVTRWLRDGDEIDLGGRTLEVIHTPGHSPDSICLLDRGARLFWTGDSFYPAPIYIYRPTTSLDEFIGSFSKMVDLTPHYDWVMPSHNEPRMEKHLIEECYEAGKSIKAGTAGPYTEGVADGIPVRRYDYDRFSLIVRAP